MNAFETVRTNSSNVDFQNLVKELDELLVIIDGPEHEYYDQYNQIDKIKHVIVLYDSGKPIGCGAIKKYDDFTFEVKRMYVSPDARNKGVATIILTSLEDWAKEMSASRCVLETGQSMTSAVKLYQKNGYTQISNYGQYAGMVRSVCFEKVFKIAS